MLMKLKVRTREDDEFEDDEFESTGDDEFERDNGAALCGCQLTGRMGFFNDLCCNLHRIFTGCR